MEGQFNEFVKRLSVLETELKLLRSQNRHLKVIVVILFSLSLLPYIMAAQQQVATFSVVRAEKIEIMGGNKTAVISISSSFSGRELFISDNNGKAIASFYAVSDNLRGLRIYNNEEEVVALLGTSVLDGSGLLNIYGNDVKNSINLSIGEYGGELRIYGKNIKGISPALEAKAGFYGGELRIFHRDGKPVAIFSTIPEGARLIIDRASFRPMFLEAITIGVTKDGTGIIETRDSLGGLLWTTPSR